MLLVNLQIKHRRRRNDVVEDVTLDFLVVDPLLVTAESIDLHWHAKLGGLQLSDHHRKVVVQLRVVVDIGFQVGTEDAEVSLLATVHDLRRVDVVGFIVFGDVFFALRDVVFHQRIVTDDESYKGGEDFASRICGEKKKFFVTDAKIECSEKDNYVKAFARNVTMKKAIQKIMTMQSENRLDWDFSFDNETFKSFITTLNKQHPHGNEAAMKLIQNSNYRAKKK